MTNQWWIPGSVSEQIKAEATVMHPYWIRRKLERLHFRTLDALTSNNQALYAFLIARQRFLEDKYYRITGRIIL